MWGACGEGDGVRRGVEWGNVEAEGGPPVPGPESPDAPEPAPPESDQHDHPLPLSLPAYPPQASSNRFQPTVRLIPTVDPTTT